PQLAQPAAVAEVAGRVPVAAGDGVEPRGRDERRHPREREQDERQPEGGEVAGPARGEEPRREAGGAGCDERRVGEDGQAKAGSGDEEPPPAATSGRGSEGEQRAGGEQAAAERVVAQAVHVEGYEGDGGQGQRDGRSVAAHETAQ